MRVSLERAKRAGGSVLEITAGVFLLAMLVTLLCAKQSQARPPRNPPAATNKAAGAGLNAVMPQLGTICVKDDSNGNQLTFDPNTGVYTFTNCSSFTLTGTGVVTVKGCTVSFLHVAADRRVVAKVELCTKRATSCAQTYSPAVIKTIADRNTADDVCGCMACTWNPRRSTGRPPA